jgi:DNA (cytosine-5)-methyltransferase 1
MKLKMLDLFSGIGGFSLAAHWTGQIETVAFCEIEPYPQKVLQKHWPDVPIFEDVRTLKGEDVGPVDIISAGFPCQDISTAGRQAGIGEGTRSGLWAEVARLIGELQPRFAIVENVSALLSGPTELPGRWFGRVLGDLAEVGYDAEWHCVPAAAVGAPHNRDRVWIVAHPQREGRQRLITDQGVFSGPEKAFPFSVHGSAGAWSDMVGGFAEVRSGDGLPVKLERNRLKALGNSIVPQVAYEIFTAMLAAN